MNEPLAIFGPAEKTTVLWKLLQSQMDQLEGGWRYRSLYMCCKGRCDRILLTVVGLIQWYDNGALMQSFAESVLRQSAATTRKCG